MGLTIAQKIFKEHLVSGNSVKPGSEIAIALDQCLNQDSTGTMVWLEFETLGLKRVQVDAAVSYNDHTSLGFKGESTDDHLFLQTIASKYGAVFSKGGNGVCHQVHYERFGKPGTTLLGADSHTPTAGSLGMIAIGAGGMDIAVALGGGALHMTVPKFMRIDLSGRLKWGVSARDIIHTILKRISVKGGVGYILEYGGEGIKNLSIPQRATITNMGAETGATTSVFPSDEITAEFLRKQKRESAYSELSADTDAVYDHEISLQMHQIVPTVAMPGMPDNVYEIDEVKGERLEQVYIGSCTNGSYRDLKIVAGMLKGKKVHPDLDLIVSPGSRQVQQMLIADGSYEVLTNAGARLIDPGCNACIGIGFVPGYQHLSLRTVNRNWPGRGGSKYGRIALGSPEVCAASAVMGCIADPREFAPVEYADPLEYPVDDSLLIHSKGDFKTTVRRGPNIVPLESQEPIEEHIEAKVVLKVGDGISTDDILPAGPLTQHLRSNLPEISKFAFSYIDEDFYARAKSAGNGIIVAGENYGQGSSREHAALAVREVGIRAVLAHSYARIHRRNLINCGILPLVLDANPFELGDVLSFDVSNIRKGEVMVASDQKNFTLHHNLTDREVSIVCSGGILGYTKKKNELKKQKNEEKQSQSEIVIQNEEQKEAQE